MLNNEAKGGGKHAYKMPQLQTENERGRDTYDDTLLYMIQLDNDILSKFPRPRDGLILVYLMARAVDGVVTTTYQQIAKDTDYSVKQVRSSLAVLESQGQTKGMVRAGLGVEITLCETVDCKPKKSLQGRPRADQGKTESKVEKRKADFYNSLIPYLQQYPKELIRAFFDYWSELNKSRTKMRFEGEKTWETDKRLTTWANNEKKYEKPTGNNRASAADKTASRYALEDLSDRILEQH